MRGALGPPGYGGGGSLDILAADLGLRMDPTRWLGSDRFSQVSLPSEE